MKATLPKAEARGEKAKNMKPEKELVSALSCIGEKNGVMKEVVIIRWYMGRSKSCSTVYCSFWVADSEGWISNSDRGSGGNYHKESATLASAYHKAQIRFDEAIDGRGDFAAHESATAIAQALGYKNTLIVKH